MAQFLWSVKGEKRLHWVSWSTICLPEDEGGLGIRLLEIIQQSLHAKLLWWAMSTDSLWARYMRAKFYHNGTWSHHTNDSPLWTSLHKQLPMLTRLCRWVVGEGNIPFWGTNWIGESIEGPFPRDISLSIKDALPIIGDMDPWISTHHRELIAQVHLHPTPDKLIFEPPDSGSFAASKYAEALRDSQPKHRWAQRILRSKLPLTLSSFLWKLLLHACYSCG